MKYPRILARITTTPWAIVPAAFAGITRALNGEAPAVDESADIDEKPTAVEVVSPFAIIPVGGIIGKRLSGLEMACGGCCLDVVQANFDAALADPAITDIVLVFDSPGGTVPGVPEFARHVRESSKATGKRVHAFTDTLMASAAYWIASACDSIYCTPTATVGSIGVYTAFEDRSEANAKAGVKINLVKAGKYKDMGSDHRALSDEESAMIQGHVDAIWEMFKASVQSERPQVDASAMEGQTFMGAEAQTAGLVDKVVADFEALLSELGVSVLGD